MIVYERPVRFEEVDAAGIAFFARFVTWAHEAMEHFFSPLEGGYAGLILARKIGLPAVHLDMSFARPLRYGDVVRIETSCARLGTRSAVLHYVMRHAASGDVAAEVKHTVVTTDLGALKSCPMPEDVRAQLAAHLAGG
ncbi:MAG TPA: thioesterase family protein [Minicystis sp.]|nr:thioesterase family protein [Minicystis sp.]